MKRLAFAVARTAPFDLLVRLAEGRSLWARDLLTVLTYHRVNTPAARPDLYPGLISATPEQFTAQMRWLAENTRVVTLDEVLAAWRGTHSLPPRAVLLTFDDAYADFGENAWPVLSRLGLPVTLFVPTAFPDSGRRFWWDRLHDAVRRAPAGARLPTASGSVIMPPSGRTVLFKRIRADVKARSHTEAMTYVDTLIGALGGSEGPPCVLSWDDLARLARDGVTLAPHSRSHPLLARVPGEQLASEIVGSADDLEQRVSYRTAAFSYPSGSHDRAARETVAAAGFEVAFTTRRGLNVIGSGDPFQLYRVNVGGSAPLPLLRAQLLPALWRAVAAIRRAPGRD